MRRVAGERRDSGGINGAGDAGVDVAVHIDRCRRRLTWQSLLRRLIVVLACGAFFPLFVIIADHTWPEGLPRWLLTGTALAWAGLLTTVGLAVAGVSLARRLNPLFVARLIERCADIRHNSLVNAWLLKHAPEGSYAYEAAARQAALDVRMHAPDAVSEPGSFRRPFAWVAVVLAAWTLYGLVSPKPLLPSLARFFGMEVPAPTATWIELLRPGTGEIVHGGEELRVEVAVRGRAVAEVLFDIVDPSDARAAPLARHSLRPVPRGPAERRHLTLAPHEVTRDIHFRCSAGDASLEGVIPVQPRPAVSALEVHLEPPVYTGWPPAIAAGPDLDVLAGTRATFRVRANVEVREAVFVLTGQRETRTRMSVDTEERSRFSLELLLRQGGEYRIEFSDQWGYPYRDPPRHQIVTRPDEPPTVKIVAPAEEDVPDGVVDVSRYPVLVAVACDDVGMAELVFTREQGGVENRTDVSAGAGANHRRMRARIETGTLPLEPGEQMRVWFEVRDGRVLLDGRAAPQAAESRVLTLVRPPDGDDTPAPADESSPEEESSAGEDREPADEDQPASRPSDVDEQAEPGAGEGDKAGEGEADDEFQRELKRFVEQHGEMARDVGRHLRGGEPPATGGESPSSQPATTQPAPQQGSSDGQTPGADESAQRSEEDSRPQPGEPQPGQQPHEGEQPEPGAEDRSSADQGEPTQTEAPADNGDGTAGESDTETGNAEAEGAGEKSESSGKGAEKAEQDTDGTGPGGSGSKSPDGSEAAPGQSPGEGGAGATEAGRGGQPAANGAGADDKGADDESETGDLTPEPPPSAGDSPIESAGLAETVDLLDMLRRGDAISEDMLVEMGWSRAKSAAFVKALERVHEAARKSNWLAGLRRIGFDGQLGESAVQHGQELAGDMATGVDGGQTPRDRLRQIAPPSEQRVPAHLRALLDAYYRSLAEGSQ